jgi:tetratricopeptide (TPR) repeat protein
VTPGRSEVIMCAMTDDLYERYKEALRTGHVAVLRGSPEEALAAYQLATQLAPSRALPHTSLGGVYMRLGHLEDALTEFAAAVAISGRDEGALLGQAEALAATGMRSDAAAALDRVAEIQEAGGRLPEAADTLRRAVELEEAPARIRRQRALLREIRFSAGDHAAEQLLARALRLRDEPAPTAPSPAAGPAVTAGLGAVAVPTGAYVLEAEAIAAFAPVLSAQPVEPEPDPRSLAAEAVAAEPEPVPDEPEPEPVAAEPEPVPDEPEPELVAAEPEPEPELEPVAVGASAAPVGANSGGRPAVGVMEGVDPPTILAGSIGESGPQPTGDELLSEAEAADLAGDGPALRSLLLSTARAYAREGRFDAGLDATDRLLQRSPSDVDAHLVLVDLYVARSWDGLAAEKLRLLGRIAELDNDEETRQRLCAAATRAFPQDPSLEHLCA